LLDLQHKYLPYPYKSTGGEYCLDTKATDFRNPLKYHDIYSRTACFIECREEYIVRKCKCKGPTDLGDSLHF